MGSKHTDQNCNVTRNQKTERKYSIEWNQEGSKSLYWLHGFKLNEINFEKTFIQVISSFPSAYSAISQIHSEVSVRHFSLNSIIRHALYHLQRLSEGDWMKSKINKSADWVNLLESITNEHMFAYMLWNFFLMPSLRSKVEL